MSGTSHEQGSSHQSQDAAPERPFNRVTTDAKNDVEQKKAATGIDSIQGGKRVSPADGHQSSPGTGEEAQAKNANSTGQDREEGKKNASQQQRSSLTRPTDINSDNNGPVHDGDTAG
jgi:hypothetical protein